ncbi:MAG: hypothetical protein A2538_00945 [Candidatus Magasanikbacteria bacterium RIFOXYD2_FULL_41_14]|uniref:Cell shape determination protein CcmA n=1 Tax=Candidatus Magasanikbacteria bacterium RIFOXYD2_FULL_41_14 TaxID=1798709 RepID=A0A1F6PE16_9BACT|nr:MAG: hypothetical protein A2538_00945 [Candidatus Magasanikbacteria bacterium RIFOXYD2_FULL_41_14]
MFQKPSPSIALENEDDVNGAQMGAGGPDEVETVVGPSVNVEGDFASEGNIIVKGSVSGSVHTSRHLSVETGAKIMANVRAGGARIAGEVRGNIKVKEDLELMATARVVGDIEAKVLKIDAGALLFGKVAMPGLSNTDNKSTARSRGNLSKKGDNPILELAE